MFWYNNNNNNTIDDDDDEEDVYMDEIRMKSYDYDNTNTNTNNNDTCESIQYNMIDMIVQHPFMERLELQMDVLHNCREKIRIIPYKITKHSLIDNVEYFVEYSINDDFLSTNFNSKSNLINDIVDDMLVNLSGKKKMIGYVKFKGHIYLFVQVRDNNGIEGRWITNWDILVNKHCFGEKIQQNVIDFFIHHSNVSDLIYRKQRCSKPMVLYTRIDPTYIEYINRHQSIQYCQMKKEPLITLNHYLENDNIRTICFVEDCDFSTNNRELIAQDSIQIKQDNQILWLFKNENEIVSYSTKK